MQSSTKMFKQPKPKSPHHQLDTKINYQNIQPLRTKKCLFLQSNTKEQDDNSQIQIIHSVNQDIHQRIKEPYPFIKSPKRIENIIDREPRGTQMQVKVQNCSDFARISGKIRANNLRLIRSLIFQNCSDLGLIVLRRIKRGPSTLWLHFDNGEVKICQFVRRLFRGVSFAKGCFWFMSDFDFIDSPRTIQFYEWLKSQVHMKKLELDLSSGNFDIGDLSMSFMFNAITQMKFLESVKINLSSDQGVLSDDGFGYFLRALRNCNELKILQITLQGWNMQLNNQTIYNLSNYFKESPKLDKLAINLTKIDLEIDSRSLSDLLSGLGKLYQLNIFKLDLTSTRIGVSPSFFKHFELLSDSWHRLTQLQLLLSESFNKITNTSIIDLCQVLPKFKSLQQFCLAVGGIKTTKEFNCLGIRNALQGLGQLKNLAYLSLKFDKIEIIPQNFLDLAELIKSLYKTSSFLFEFYLANELDAVQQLHSVFKAIADNIQIKKQKINKFVLCVGPRGSIIDNDYILTPIIFQLTSLIPIFFVDCKLQQNQEALKGSTEPSSSEHEYYEIQQQQSDK